MRDSTILRHGELIAVSTADAVMFMQVDAGQYRMLTDTARDIWFLIDGKRSVSEIVDSMLASYDVDPGTCDAEVRAFLSELSSNGMVEVVA